MIPRFILNGALFKTIDRHPPVAFTYSTVLYIEIFPSSDIGATIPPSARSLPPLHLAAALYSSPLFLDRISGPPCHLRTNAHVLVDPCDISGYEAFDPSHSTLFQEPSFYSGRRLAIWSQLCRIVGTVARRRGDIIQRRRRKKFNPKNALHFPASTLFSPFVRA